MKIKWVGKNVLIWIIAILVSIPIISILPDHVDAKCTYVSGYTKKNGTRVSGYTRGCGKTSETINTKSYTPSYNDSNSYYGSSKIINLYKGKNFVGTTDSNKLVYVKGYYQKDGTYIRPHFRTHPNNYLNDNFSYFGISSLTPKQKYPQFIFSSDKDIAMKEKYLLYNLSDYSLNEKQLSILKSYTIALKEAESNKQKERSAISLGTQFYKDLNHDEYLAVSNTKFDLYGIFTLEDYLYNVVNSIVPNLRASIVDTQILETYAYLLSEARNDPTKLKIARNYGKNFYKIIGADSISIEKQLEMDELQTFDTTPNNASNWPITQLESIDVYSLANGEVRNYLIKVGASYEIVFNFNVILDSISYQTSLELLYGGSEYFLNSAFTEGIRFYTNQGLDNEEAKSQTIIDINVILSS